VTMILKTCARSSFGFLTSPGCLSAYRSRGSDEWLSGLRAGDGLQSWPECSAIGVVAAKGASVPWSC